MRGRGAGMDVGMSDTKSMLQKIAALRERLMPIAPPPEPPTDAPAVRTDPAHAVAEKILQGGWHNRLIDRTLRVHDPAGDASPPAIMPPRLTASGARLLRKGASCCKRCASWRTSRRYASGRPIRSVRCTRPPWA